MVKIPAKTTNEFTVAITFRSPFTRSRLLVVNLFYIQFAILKVFTMHITYCGVCSTTILPLSFLCFPEAHQYIESLKTDGVNIPVDKDVGSYTMQLPDWYDEKMYKR